MTTLPCSRFATTAERRAHVFDDAQLLALHCEQQLEHVRHGAVVPVLLGGASRRPSAWSLRSAHWWETARASRTSGGATPRTFLCVPCLADDELYDDASAGDESGEGASGAGGSGRKRCRGAS